MRVLVLLLMTNFSFAAENVEQKFTKLMNSYDKMYTGFLKKDLKSVKNSAGILLEDISNFSDAKIIKSLNFTKKKLQVIKDSDSLDQTHDAFNIVSQALYATSKKYGNLKGYSRYFCPMEKKYWIQADKVSKTNNPYAVDSMPHCGSKK